MAASRLQWAFAGEEWFAHAIESHVFISYAHAEPDDAMPDDGHPHPRRDRYSSRPPQCLHVGAGCDMCVCGSKPCVVTWMRVDIVSHDAYIHHGYTVGFSFKGAVRAPFDHILATIKEAATPVCAVDIPSG